MFDLRNHDLKLHENPIEQLRTAANKNVDATAVEQCGRFLWGGVAWGVGGGAIPCVQIKFGSETEVGPERAWSNLTVKFDQLFPVAVSFPQINTVFQQR